MLGIGSSASLRTCASHISLKLAQRSQFKLCACAILTKENLSQREIGCCCRPESHSGRQPVFLKEEMKKKSLVSIDLLTYRRKYVYYPPPPPIYMRTVVCIGIAATF